MKVSAGATERFLVSPDPAMLATLIYGPDTGLARERAKILAGAVVDDLSDPFRTATVTAASLRDDPARLADEAAAMSLTGGRRVIFLRDATDGMADTLKSLLEHGAGDALVIAEAGELGPRSRLRRLFEDAENAAAIACYPDDQRTLGAVIAEMLSEAGLSASPDAMIYLRENLGGNRLVTRMELDKLIAYATGEPGATEVTLDDAMACVGDSAGLTLEDIAFAAASGNQALLARTLGTAFDEGANPVTVLRAAARHFQRLHLAAGAVAAGESAERALKALRPPVFFKRSDEFRAQLGRWNVSSLAAAIVALTDAEIACKSTGVPAETSCARALMRLATRPRG